MVVMEKIENELIHKFHCEHVDDNYGNSPCRGRAEGFKLLKQARRNNHVSLEDNSYILKAFKLAMQAVARTRNLLHNELCSVDVIDRAANEMIAMIGTNVSPTTGEDLPYKDLLQWYRDGKTNGYVALVASKAWAIYTNGSRISPRMNLSVWLTSVS